MAKGDIISRLKLESGEFDSKIKRAGQELLAYSEHCKKMGLEMGYANRDAKEFAKQLGSMATVSQTARGKISELSEAFVNAKVMYKNMTDEEKKGEFGKNLAASLDQLKGRLDAAKKDLADVNKELAGGGKFGEFGNVLDTLGSKLGVTGNLTEMLTSKTALLTGAVGAGIAVVTKSAEAWANYNAELAKQDQITQVTTGLKGEDADRMTDKIRALSDTYNVDFREAVNAANTLMTQFGKTGDEATQLIKDGMRGMIQGDGPKLLSMIQQYAPAFRDAGVSASQLVAVIQNSEGGIFTDQNMNAIVMGIKNIRLMTKATSDALAQLGIDGEKMSKQLSDGSLTIFDALKKVANQIQTVDSNSKEAGEVMQQVFGRQGAMAGTKLGEAIATLNTNLEKTKVQTGEVGDSLADLQEANEKLNTAIRDCFEYDGWDKMANGIRANLITALAAVVEKLADIKSALGGLPLPSQIKSNQSAGQKDMNERLDNLKNSDVKQIQNRVNMAYYNQQVSQRQFKVNSLTGDDAITKGLRKKAEADLQAWKNLRDEYSKKANEILTSSTALNKKDEKKVTPDLNPNPRRTTGGKSNTNAPTYAADSIAAQQALVSELTKKWNEASQDMQQGYVAQLVVAEEKLRKMKEDAAWMKDLAMGKYSGKGDFRSSMKDAASVRFNTTLDDMVKDGKDKAKSGTMMLSDKAMSVVTKQIKDATKPQKKEEKSAVEVFGQMNSGINQIVGGIEGLGITIPEELSGILGGINSMLSILQGITILVQGIAAMQEIGTFLGIFSNGGIVPHAANGYYVPGNRFSGDNTPIMANAGELVLNRAQQGNLASQLSDIGLSNLQIDTVVGAESITFVINNRGRRTGKGEFVQSRRIR